MLNKGTEFLERITKMNIPSLLTLTACTVVVLKLLGYITISWMPILWGIGIVFIGMVIMLVLAVAFAQKNVNRFLSKRERLF